MIIKLIMCDLGWLVLFCVICRTQICRFRLKTQFSAIFKLKHAYTAQQTKKNYLND